MKTPKIRGFKLECIDHEAHFNMWREHRHDLHCPPAYVEFGASPIRDHNSMVTYMAEAKTYGIEYNVFAIV